MQRGDLVEQTTVGDRAVDEHEAFRADAVIEADHHHTAGREAGSVALRFVLRPVVNRPPYSHTMAGSPEAFGSGVHTLTVNHSSVGVTRIGCGGGGPNSVASRTPSHGSSGTGAANRKGPTGGSA
jgi:hypothetical protein